MGGKRVKHIKCVLQINTGNYMKEKVKGSSVGGLISVKSEFLDTVFTFQHSKHRCGIFQLYIDPLTIYTVRLCCFY